MSRPHGIYTGWVKRLLISVLPFAFIASYPVEGLFEPFRSTLLLHAAAVVCGAALVVHLLWRAGMRAYSSASS